MEVGQATAPQTHMIYASNFSGPFLPESLDDFVISDTASRLQLNGMVNGTLPMPLFGKNAICLWGSYGTGKTTLATILPQLFEASGSLVCSQRRGIFLSDRYWEITTCGIARNSVSLMDKLIERCTEGVGYSPSGWHYEILDEVDLLSDKAQESLKGVITSAVSTIFVLTTNHPNKLDRGIVSRSVLIEMNQSASAADYERLARRFLKRMGLSGDELSVEQIATYANAARGDLREFGTAIAVEGVSRGGSLTASRSSNSITTLLGKQ